jgi:hypothetical protein
VSCCVVPYIQCGVSRYASICVLSGVASSQRVLRVPAHRAAWSVCKPARDLCVEPTRRSPLREADTRRSSTTLCLTLERGHLE